MSRVVFQILFGAAFIIASFHKKTRVGKWGSGEPIDTFHRIIFFIFGLTTFGFGIYEWLTT